jgi:glycosyltransferase involved in cell wall biosynthesis
MAAQKSVQLHIDDTTEPREEMAVAPTVSVIICTRDRPDTIERAIESVSIQPLSAFEVLIVDQSRTDETRAIVERLMLRFPHVRYLHLDRPGLSRAYNAGIRNTTAELIAFTDDDCVVPATWLPTIERIFAAEQDVALIYGQVLAPLDIQDSDDKGIIPTLTIPQRRRLSQRDGFTVFGMGANFAVRRATWNRVGGFDEVLGGGGPLKSSQDFDFAYRVFRVGQTILLDPDVVVFHYGLRHYSDWPATLQAYGVGDGGFYFKHVRAGDLYAARLLTRNLAVATARETLHSLRRGGAQWGYLQGVVVGLVRSIRYGVDRRQRLYYVRAKR